MNQDEQKAAKLSDEEAREVIKAIEEVEREEADSKPDQAAS
jgi:hypothetical protein